MSTLTQNQASPAAPAFINFNRHEVFTQELMDATSKLIRAVEDSNWEKNQKVSCMLQNDCCGLWDGYLYNNLVQKITDFGCSADAISKAQMIVDAVEQHRAAHGPSEILIY